MNNIWVLIKIKERKEESNMKHLLRVLLFSLSLMVIVTGCGRSIEKDLIGVWKIADEEETSSYLEFSDERLIVREDFDDVPELADYRLTELQKGEFMIEIAEPGTTTYIFFLEGKFDKKDKINITKAMDAGDKTFDLVRVKDFEKEKNK